MIAKFVKAKGYKVHSGVSVGCCVCVQTPLSLDWSDERLSLKSQLHVLYVMITQQLKNHFHTVIFNLLAGAIKSHLK